MSTTREVRIFVDVEMLSAGNPNRVYARSELNGAAQAPGTLPKFTASKVSAGAWSDEVAAANMKNAVDDTETINGALYYYDYSPSGAGARNLRVSCDISSLTTIGQTTIEVDPAVAEHRHTGVDSPQVDWDDIANKPEGLDSGETEITVIEVADQASQTSHGLREGAVKESGYTDLSTQQVRAGALLGDLSPVEETIELVMDLASEPSEGDSIEFVDVGVTKTVLEVSALGGGRYKLVLGNVVEEVVDAAARDSGRLSRVERYE